MAKKTLTMKNAPKASGRLDDFAEQMLELERGDMEALAAEAPAKVVETADERYVRQIKEAQAKLGDLRLRPMTLTLLAAACANVASSDGRGISDADARQEIQDRAALFVAFGNELPDVLDCIADSVAIEDVPGQVYSTCFAVQKATNFVTNLKYRTALDADDGEGIPVHDHRERSEPPCGLGPEGEEPVEFDGVREHADAWIEPHIEILTAYEELHVYLQLLAEAYGWDTESPMPYLFVAQLDGTFNAVHGAEHALDIMEVRSKESRARRAKKRSAGLQAALAGARTMLKNAGRKAA